MKQLMCLFTIICISINAVLGQGSFEIILSNPTHQDINDCIEDLTGNIYIVGENVNVENSQIVSSCGTIYKIDLLGNILQEVEFCYPDSCVAFYEVDIINDSIFVLGTSGSAEIGYNEFFDVYILNYELEVIDHSKIKLFTDKYLGDVRHLVNPSGDIVAMGVAIIPGEILETDIYFYKFHNNLDSILCAVDDREYNQWGMDFILDTIIDGYKVYAHGNYSRSVSFYDELIRFDSIFNFVSIDTIPWRLLNQHTFKWLTDSTYLLTGNKRYIYTYYTNVDIGVAILNGKDELLSAASFGKSVDTVDYAGVKDNIDFVTKDNIYFGGTSNFIVIQWPWQTDNSWINLINLDSNLNVNWQRFYGGDAFYTLYGLKATQDGGCFLYACRYDENINYQEYDIYILKVDSNGLLTSVNDIPNIAANELFIYPNPASSQITVKFPGVSNLRQKDLLIYNNLGIQVSHSEIPDSQECIAVSTENLSAGLYQVSIISDGNRVASGKFLIAR